MSARQFAKISIYIDRDEDWQKLPTDAQWLYAHLLHQPNLSTAGVLPIQVEKWAKASADMTPQRVRTALNVLVERRFIVSDLETQELLIRTFIRHDVAAQGSPKIMKGALNCALQTESPELRAILLSEIRKLDRPLPDDLLPLADSLEDSLDPHPPKGFLKASQSQSKGCVVVAVEGGGEVGAKPTNNASPSDCANCGRLPSARDPNYPGLCGACITRQRQGSAW
jgi:hypothetical protein